MAITDDYGYFLHPDERAYGIVDERFLRRYFCVATDTSDTISLYSRWMRAQAASFRRFVWNG